MDNAEECPPMKKRRRNSAYLARKALKRRLKGESARSTESREARKKSDSRLTKGIREARMNNDLRRSEASIEARKNNDLRRSEACLEARRNNDLRRTQAGLKARKNNDLRRTQASLEARENNDLRRTQASLEARENNDLRRTQASLEARENSELRRTEACFEARIGYDEKRQNIEYLVQEYEESIGKGPDIACQCCDCLFFIESIHWYAKSDLKRVNEELYEQIYCIKEEGDDIRLCNTCGFDIWKGKVPRLCVSNGLKFPCIPPELEMLSPLEERLVSPRLPFMQIRELRVGKQLGIKGNVVNIPISVEKSIETLPRTFDKMETIQLLLKRMRHHKSSYLNELIRPAVVYSAAHFLVQQPLYNAEGVKLDIDWTQLYSNVVEKFLVEKHEDEAALENSPEICDNWDETNEDQPLNPNKEETYLKEGLIFAPGEGEHPVSILTDKTVEELAFPRIFCGQARQLTNNLSFSDICRSELKRTDRRCVNPPNIFFKLRKKEMAQHRSAIQIYLRRGYSKDLKVTVQEAMDREFVSKLVHEDEAYKVLIGDRSSPAYWQGRMKELMAMIRQLGKPDFFLTLSAAETHWFELLIILVRVLRNVEYNKDQALAMSFEEKCELIRRDPVTCARYFDHRIRQLFKIIRAPCGAFAGYKVIDTYIRVEFQSRGSPHVHCLIWLENAPVFEQHVKETWKTCEQFIDKFISCEVGSFDGIEKLQYHKHSASCKKTRMDSIVCRFGIPQFPMRTTQILSPLGDDDMSEDERESFDHIMFRIEEALETVDNKVKNKDLEIMQMTFDDFLIKANVSEYTYLRVLRNNLKRPQVFLRRRPVEIRTNAYNPLLLKLHRANMDLQYILDPYACVHYILNYINKSNRGMSTLLKEVVDECKRGNVSHQQKLYKVCSRFLNCSEVSVQEAVYILLSIPLSKASREIIFINTGEKEKRTRMLKTQKELEKLEIGSTDIMNTGLFDYYINRPDELESICLADFASKFTFKKSAKGESIDDTDEESNSHENISNRYRLKNNLGTVHKRKRAKVIRYRKYQLIKEPLHYYREKIMLYVPWRDEDKDILQEDVEVLYHRNKEHILNIEKEYVFDAQLNLDDLEHKVEEEKRISFESNQQEDVALDYQVFDLQNPDYNIETDIKEQRNTNKTGTFLCPNFISDDNYTSLIRSLNEEQRNFFLGLMNVVKTQNDPFYYFLTGGAGTGKSLLIKSIYQTLNRWFNRDGANPDEIKVLLLGPTGKSAFNIRGTTIHSALAIPVTQNGQMKNLSADLKNTLMKRLNRLKVIIIDEISMVGASMLRRIDHRLKEIFNTQQLFGGISILFVGDLNQLRPVMDNFIFKPPGLYYATLAGTFLWSTVQFYKLTEIMRQKDDFVFAQALNRLAVGCLTDEDKQLFRRRLFSKGSPELPVGAVRLFQFNEQVNRYNDVVLEETEGHQYHSSACDFAAPGLSKKIREHALGVVSRLPTQATYNLPKELALKIGIRYMVSTNVDVEDGLVNGTTGILRHIDCDDDQVRSLWFEFEEIDIGIKARSKFPVCTKNSKTLTPIERVVRDIQTKLESRFILVSRKQFPLLVAEAITIHKAQGQTYDEVVIDMSRKMDLAKFYTSFSRAKTLSGLYLTGQNIIFPKERSESHPVSLELKRLETEALLVFNQKFPAQVKKEGRLAIYYQNIPYLNKHADAFSSDINIRACDILAFVEIRANHIKIDGFDLRHSLPYEGLRPFGIAFYIRTGLYMESEATTKVYMGQNNSHIEEMRVDLQFAVVLIYYVSPNFNKMEAMELIERDIAASVNRNLFIIGDWNIDITSSAGEEFFRMMRQFGLRKSPQTCSPSTDRGSTIDYLFTSMDIEDSFYYESLISDHKGLVSFLR